MKLYFWKYFFGHFLIYHFFFHLKKIELCFFYLQLFVTDASLNSTASVHPLITRNQCAVTKTHQCSYLYISTNNKKFIFKAPKLLLGVSTKIYCLFFSNAGRKYHNYIEWKFFKISSFHNISQSPSQSSPYPSRDIIFTSDFISIFII